MKFVKTSIVLCSLAMLAGCAKKTIVDTAAHSPTSSAVATESVDSGTIAAPAAIREGEVREPTFSLARGHLETIHFDYDSFTLTDEARERLTRNAQWLRANPTVRITIEGHTDERGSDAYNLALGEQRARTALNYLTNLGIPGERMTITSFGEERPAAPGQGEEVWSKNRRAEFM